MKRTYLSFSCMLLCILLAGCAIGEYKVADVYLDENDNQHFMGFGTIGPSGGEESVENKEVSEEADLVGENENLLTEDDDSQKNEKDYNLESIIGTSLKRGWTSSDNSILKGKNVSVKEDSILFSINLAQDREITIAYDIILDNGEYQLVYISPDNTEKVLQDSEIIQAKDKIMFTQGQNKIAVLSNDAMFKEIDIQIVGVKVSDFE